MYITRSLKPVRGGSLCSVELGDYPPSDGEPCCKPVLVSPLTPVKRWRGPVGRAPCNLLDASRLQVAPTSASVALKRGPLSCSCRDGASGALPSFWLGFTSVPCCPLLLSGLALCRRAGVSSGQNHFFVQQRHFISLRPIVSALSCFPFCLFQQLFCAFLSRLWSSSMTGDFRDPQVAAGVESSANTWKRLGAAGYSVNSWTCLMLMLQGSAADTWWPERKSLPVSLVGTSKILQGRQVLLLSEALWQVHNPDEASDLNILFEVPDSRPSLLFCPPKTYPSQDDPSLLTSGPKPGSSVPLLTPSLSHLALFLSTSLLFASHLPSPTLQHLERESPLLISHFSPLLQLLLWATQTYLSRIFGSGFSDFHIYKQKVKV